MSLDCGASGEADHCARRGPDHRFRANGRARSEARRGAVVLTGRAH
jgi:hypothetical protein